MSLKDWLRKVAKPAGKIASEFGTEIVAEGMFGRSRGKIIHEASEAKLKTDLTIESKRASLLDDIAKMDKARRAVLHRRLRQARERTIPSEYGGISRITENELVSTLASLRSDEDGRRTAKLERLADLPDREFWTEIDLLWDNRLQQASEQSLEIVTEGVNRMAEAAGLAVGAAETLDHHGAAQLDKVIAKMDTAGVRRHGRRS